MARCCSKGLLLLLAAFAFPAFAQAQVFHDFGFVRTNHTAVYSNEEQLLLFPWAGGLNSIRCQAIDLNHDHLDDLLVFDKHGNRLIPFLNNGSTDHLPFEFAPEYSRFFPPIHDWVIFADYDGDDQPDIFTYGLGGISVYHNISDDPNTAFELVTEQLQSEYYGSSTNLYASPDDYLAVTDIDGDGDLDILNFWILGKYVHLHKNYSMEEYGDCGHLIFRLEDECWGHFEEGDDDNAIQLGSDCGRKSEPSRHVGSSLHVEDFTGNGLPDLVLGDMDFPNLILLENGGTMEDAQMTAQLPFPSPEDPIQLYSMPVLSFVDIDNNGFMEILASPAAPNLDKSQDLNSVWAYRYSTENNRYVKIQEDFLQDQMIDVGSGAIPVLYDWDGDGRTDLFVGNYGSYDSSVYENGFLTSHFTSSIAYFHNTGTNEVPVFQLETSDFGNLRQWGKVALAPALGDVDRDGITDLVCGEKDGTLTLFRNLSADPAVPFFAPPVENFTGVDVGDYAVPQLFDLNRDGKNDLLVGNRRGRIAYLQNHTEQQMDFRLVTDTLGSVDVRNAEISYFGYCVPCFFRHPSQETVLFCGTEQGHIVYYDQIDGNLGGTFRQREAFLIDNTRETIREGIRCAPAVADLNQDGYVDLIAGNWAGGLSFFEGATPLPVSAEQPLCNKRTASVFPNPTTGLCTVKLPENTCGWLCITDTFGRAVLSRAICNEQQISLNLSPLPSGIYVGQIRSNGQWWFFKIIRK
ncbi:MAG: T9SS type A sorting domain-containing protein [Bacteroidales bacterium]|nr:T9SS type A sorting domain-containing protein [Bacteroidales bacterium]